MPGITASVAAIGTAALTVHPAAVVPAAPAPVEVCIHEPGPDAGRARHHP